MVDREKNATSLGFEAGGETGKLEVLCFYLGSLLVEVLCSETRLNTNAKTVGGKLTTLELNKLN